MPRLPFILIVLALAARPVLAGPLTGIVVGIADGATLTLVDGQRRQHVVRLAGIDAPEPGQPQWQQSKTRLSALVFNREVEVISERKDRHGRTLGKVMAAELNCNTPACPKIHDVNLMQVMSGMAWWNRPQANTQPAREREDYEVAEFSAKVRRLGLWADKNPIPPWEWRVRR